MRWLIPFLVPCAAALILCLGLLIWLGDETTRASSAPDYSSQTIGGVQYSVAGDSEIDPSSAADARFIKGMPAGERRVPKGDVLFGVFVSRTNSEAATLPSASRIDLLDGLGRAHRPLRLSPENPYTYAAGTIAPGGQLPAPGTRPADDIAASGQLLLYRVPVQQVANGWLELAVHDPLHPGAVDHVQL
jgi:hypothetical protein